MLCVPTHPANSGGFTYHQNTPTVSKEVISVIENKTIEFHQVLSNYADRALTKTHGIFMLIAWPIFAGLAIYFPAYTKPIFNKKGEWFKVS